MGVVNKMVEQVKTKSEPYVRFRGFDDEWNEVKLGDVGKTRSGIGFPNSEQGGLEGLPFFKVSDMNNDGNENKMVHANNYVSDQQITNKRWKPISDTPCVIFAKVGAAIMLNRKRLVDEPFLIDNNMMAYVFDNTWDTTFGKTLFDTVNLPRYAQTGALPSYNGSDIETIKIHLPSLDEQQKIGELFQTLDKTIDLSSTHVENLKQQKKALLQRLFPQKGETEPKVRLCGFTDEWNEVKLGELLSYEQPTKYIVDSDNYDDNFITPVLTAGKSFLLGYTDETDGVYNKGDVILFDDFTTATQLVDFKFKVKSSAMKLLTPTDDNNINFLYETLNLVHYPHDDHKRYWISEYATLKVKTPSDLQEQQAIGELFQTVDEQIRLAEDKVSQYKELKQALLQRLFV